MKKLLVVGILLLCSCNGELSTSHDWIVVNKQVQIATSLWRYKITDGTHHEFTYDSANKWNVGDCVHHGYHNDVKKDTTSTFTIYEQ